MASTNVQMSANYQDLQLVNLSAYLKLIGKKTDYHIEKCFSCGMPRVWMYYRSLGLEDKFFDLLQAAQEPGSTYYRDLIYGLILTQENSKFFAKVPADYLELNLPKDIAAAIVQLQAPDFQIAYSFTGDQLKDTLQKISQHGKMISLGNKQNSIGLMIDADDKYLVYRVGNTQPLTFTNASACVDYIMQYISGAEPKQLRDIRLPIYIERYDIEGRLATPAPKPLDLIEKYNNSNSHDYNLLSKDGIDPLYLAVRAGLTEQVKYWHEMGVQFGRSYNHGANLLSLAAHDRNIQMITLLLQYKEIEKLLPETLDILKQDHEGCKLLHEYTTDAHVWPKRFLPSESKKTPN